MEELLKSLIYIQQNLNAPKDQFNSFGKYKYRSLEGIQAAIKPLLAEQSCGIRFEDQVVEHCGRTFLRTTLYFFNEKGQSISTTSEAEHAATKSGMDASQITGAASSYARKYALNGMFCIDDSQDADTDLYHNQTNNQGSYTGRKNQQSRPVQTQKQPVVDSFASLKEKINSTNDVATLVSIYLANTQLMEANPEIKSLLTNRKKALQTLNAA